MRWKRLIYCSHARVSMENPLNLSEILGASARNNRRDEITGILAFADGMFLQAIEGRQGVVDGLMARLLADPRHHKVKVLGEDFSTERAFSVWVMETPKMRPDRLAMLRTLVEEGCEGSYGKALGMTLKLAQEQADQRSWA